jgi:transcriptional antiterminator RfaH
MTPSAPTPDPWYVVHTRTLKEASTALVLREHLDLEVYFPQVCRQSWVGLHCTPLFPGYLFVRVNLNRVTPSRINSCPGVLRLLESDNEPQAVPANVISSIHAGVERLNAQGGWPLPGFQPGARVRVKEGPFDGLDAIFIGPATPRQRVIILLEFLGGMRRVQLDVSAVESCAITRPLQHKRSTRGRGRTIRVRTFPQ